ncbi:MAG: sigma-70 family RNA polymerase sigma factor [Myxococcales bacterium]|nr:sigma-70 family RNA polymerase sigma factor [Myxococcales bacterium]
MPDSTFLTWVGELARTHTRALAATARREGLSPTDALDAVQEALHTFLLIPHARDLADDVDDSARLLRVVVRNVARNMRRRHHRARPHVELDDAPLSAAELSSEELLLRAEEHVRLRGCVDMLGELQRRVVTLRMLEEYSPREVADELGIKPGYVAVLLHRAKRSIERCLLE